MEDVDEYIQKHNLHVVTSEDKEKLQNLLDGVEKTEHGTFAPPEVVRGITEFVRTHSRDEQYLKERVYRKP